MILCGDAVAQMQTLDAQSVDTCVTSPPYYGLRSYNSDGQIGLEQTYQEYIAKLVDVFREVWRVLRDDGTLWVVIGDSYSRDSKYGGSTGGKHVKALHGDPDIGRRRTYTGLPSKNLIGIPWRLAFALQDDGWILRNDNIWQKTNAMPESVKDRCTRSHEYIFLLAKKPRYYFDAEAIAEPAAGSTIRRLSQDIEHQSGSTRQPGKTNGPMKAAAPRYGGKKYTENPDVFYRTKSAHAYDYKPRRNCRDVWTVSTANYKGAHFATFPPELIRPCILAGCKPGGTVLDPFCGSGTTGFVALATGRQFIGIDINPEYCEMSRQRIGIQ
jgi:DNA modification methylase